MTRSNNLMLTPATQKRSLTLQAAEGVNLPQLIEDAGDHARATFFEFFAATIRNPNTRAAYAQAVGQFYRWCSERGIGLHDIEPAVLAAYIEQHPGSPATVKQHLAAIQMLGDYLVIKQVVKHNPASVVRGPRHVVEKGKTPVIPREDIRAVLAAIPDERLIDHRDRALITTMLFSFARVGAITKMLRGDYQSRGKTDWLRLYEKGGKHHEVPAHHLSVEALDRYIEAGAITDSKAPLFQSVNRSGELTGNRIGRENVSRMLKRRCRAAEVTDIYTPHSLRAAGITIYLEEGGSLEHAQAIAAHASPRTTKLYDRTSDVIELGEIERMRL